MGPDLNRSSTHLGFPYLSGLILFCILRVLIEMSETSSKEFESKFEDTMKWKNSKEESAAGSPESKDKESR